MTIGELMAHLAVAAKAFRQANHEATIEEFHALEIVVAVRRDFEPGGEVRRALGGASFADGIILETLP